jgi:hypothetical protein
MADRKTEWITFWRTLFVMFVMFFVSTSSYIAKKLLILKPEYIVLLISLDLTLFVLMLIALFTLIISLLDI